MLFTEYRQLQFTLQALLESTDRPIQRHSERTFADSYGPLEIPVEFADYDHVESYDHGTTLITSFGVGAKGEILWSMIGMNPMTPSQFPELMTSEAQRNPETNPLYKRTLQLDDTGVQEYRQLRQLN